jgi:hypothetical protein
LIAQFMFADMQKQQQQQQQQQRARAAAAAPPTRMCHEHTTPHAEALYDNESSTAQMAAAAA